MKARKAFQNIKEAAAQTSHPYKTMERTTASKRRLIKGDDAPWTSKPCTWQSIMHMPPHPCHSAIALFCKSAILQKRHSAIALALPTLYTGGFVSSGGSVSRRSLSSGHCAYHDSVMTRWNFACNMCAGSALLHPLVAKFCRKATSLSCPQGNVVNTCC